MKYYTGFEGIPTIKLMMMDCTEFSKLKIDNRRIELATRKIKKLLGQKYYQRRIY